MNISLQGMDEQSLAIAPMHIIYSDIMPLHLEPRTTCLEEMALESRFRMGPVDMNGRFRTQQV